METLIKDRPFIVRFENRVSVNEFDVVIHHKDCSRATEWTNQYFGSHTHDYRDHNTVKYLHSDFDSNHTYHITLK